MLGGNDKITAATSHSQQATLHVRRRRRDERKSDATGPLAAITGSAFRLDESDRSFPVYHVAAGLPVMYQPHHGG